MTGKEAIFYDVGDGYQLLQWLNDLDSENEAIKYSLGAYMIDLENYKAENKRLKQEINRLYNYFEDWYRDMTSANDFSEIWDNVKEDERWGDDVE